MIAAALEEEVEQFIQQHLNRKDADGVYCNARLDDEKLCLLVIIGVTADGKKELVAVHQGVLESEQSWLEVLRELKSRGLAKAPKLAICDGALGFQNAVDKVCGQMKIQRCWFHKMGNVLDKMPECVLSSAKKSSSEYVYGRGGTSGHPIESMFAAVRLRHRSTKGNGSSKATLTMVFKLCKEAEKNWRRLKEFEKLRLVQQDVIFVDGLLAA